MPKARVLFDSHGYHDGEQTRHANKDEIIDVTAAELERGIELGSLEKVSDAAAKKAAKEADEGTPDPKVAGSTDPAEPTTPAGDPVGDGKHDQDAK